jgi:hypothetical protein
VRRIPRKSLAVSLAAALSLGVSATAFAAGADDQTSEMVGSIAPTLQDDNDKGKATLYTEVSHYDNDAPATVLGVPVEVDELDFPGEVTYKTNNKLAKCDPDAGTFATDGTDAVVEDCASALIGAGSAYARIPGYPLDGGQAELTVAAFNGPTSVAGDQDSTDVPTGGFDGGNPTIVLHADNAILPTTVVLGEIRDSPTPDTATVQYGVQLYVPDAPDVGADTGSLVLFSAQVNRKWNNGKKGDKKKTYDLISATCDEGGDGDWDFNGLWRYDDASVDTFAVSQDCTEK